MAAKTSSGNGGCAIFILVYWLSAWMTHLVICFKAGSWGFLIAGAIFFPVAIVHGTGHWFGAW